MSGWLRRVVTATAVVCLALSFSSAEQKPKKDPQVAADHAEKNAKDLELFKKQVRPVLVKRCLKCHGGAQTESEFDLVTRGGLLKGGLTGQAVVVGESKNSLLYSLITHAEEPYMPCDEEKLPKQAIDSIAKWIDLGAPYDKPLVAGAGKNEVR